MKYTACDGLYVYFSVRESCSELVCIENRIQIGVFFVKCGWEFDKSSFQRVLLLTASVVHKTFRSLIGWKESSKKYSVEKKKAVKHVEQCEYNILRGWWAF